LQPKKTSNISVLIRDVKR